MNNKQIEEFALALLNFVKEAASTRATIKEIEVLPAVAEVLLELLSLTHKMGGQTEQKVEVKLDGKSIAQYVRRTGRGCKSVKESSEKVNDGRPVVDKEISQRNGNKAGNDRDCHSFSKLNFLAVLLGSFIGSFLGAVLIKILTQLL